MHRRDDEITGLVMQLIQNKKYLTDSRLLILRPIPKKNTISQTLRRWLLAF